MFPIKKHSRIIANQECKLNNMSKIQYTTPKKGVSEK